MTEQYKVYRVMEIDFGSSTEMFVKYIDGKATEVIDTSTNETNYVWDMQIDEKDYLGRDIKEIEDKLEHDFDDFEDEYRRPMWIADVVSKEDYNNVKAKELRQNHIFELRNKGAKMANERLKNKLKNPDELEKKAEIFRRAEARSRRRHSPLSKEEIRFIAYKKMLNRD